MRALRSHIYRQNVFRWEFFIPRNHCDIGRYNMYLFQIINQDSNETNTHCVHLHNNIQFI